MSPSIVRIAKSRRLQGVGHVSRLRRRQKMHKNLGGKVEVCTDLVQALGPQPDSWPQEWT
jgi:hypothetical protein